MICPLNWMRGKVRETVLKSLAMRALTSALLMVEWGPSPDLRIRSITMKRTFDCGHTGKGKYCHTCESIDRAKAAEREAREEKRSAKAREATADPIDLSAVAHLAAVQREARELLAQVSRGVHPFALDGKPIKRSNGRLLSVPVGRSWRLMFAADTLRPIELLSHERYNKYVEFRCGT